MKLLNKIKKGFTLVELVVVIAIIAILSGVSVGVYVGITNNAKQSAANQEAETIGTVVRAAVMMKEGEGGYKFTTYDVGVYKDNAFTKKGTATVRGYFSTTAGIHIELSDVAWTDPAHTEAESDLRIEEAKYVKAVFEEIEKKTLAGDLTGDGTNDNTINWFEYSPNKDGFKGKYTF